MKKILILSSVWVEPNSSAAGKRMLQLIDFFIENNYAVTYASTSLNKENAVDLSLKNINTEIIEINNSNFKIFLKNVNPDMVLYDRFIVEEQFGWQVNEIMPNAMTILDTEDLHCLRKTREICYKKKIPFNINFLLQQDITKREIASILRCDLSLIISKYEMKLLKKTFNINTSILLYLPFFIDKIPKKTKEIPFEKREHFYFIGNFLHQPNVSSVLYLKEIWKDISKKLPNAQLHIYGAYPTQQIVQLNNKKEGFLVKGHLDDLQVLKNYKLLLSPLFFGAGLKGKLFEAMQNQTPSITTKIGAEGITNNKNWCGEITDEKEVFIQTAIELYSSKNSWEKAVEKIPSILKKYNKKKYSKKLSKHLKKIPNSLEKHRNKNFISRVLNFHTLKSTKYLSKWIEEKNKI